MRITLAITAGPSAGRTLELKSGEVGLVGRASWAQLSVPRDLSMAGQHFKVEFGPNGWTLNVLNRQNPVFLNGTKVSQAPLNDGDQLLAGENTFRVSVLADDGAPAPPAPSPEPAVTPQRPRAISASEMPAPSTVRRQVPPPAPAPKLKPAAKPPERIDLLRQAQPLFALLDAARDEDVLATLKASGEEFQSLYEGYAADELENVSPYLVRLPPASKFLEFLAREAWGKSWGVYLTSHAPLREVRKHLRHFLKVESDGEEYLFRFYDPRVLRVFLPNCDAEETKQIFGPVDIFWMEASEPEIVLKYTATPKGPRQELVLAGVL